MRQDLLVPEVLTRVHNTPNVDDKKKILKQNETPGLLYCLRFGFCPGVSFDVVCPEYNASIRPAGTDHAGLQGEARRLYIFTSEYKKITRERKMELLLQILEAVNATEARLLEQIIKRDIKVNGLTANLVNEVFPGLLDYRSADGKDMIKFIPTPDSSDGPFNVESASPASAPPVRKPRAPKVKTATE